jgi:membrane fusion protein (multidrug efflux system)
MADERVNETKSGNGGRRGPLLIGVAVLLVVGVLGSWLYFAGKESTDDAQIDGHISPISARVGGTVIAVNVKDNQAVKAGQVLVQIDPKDYEVAVARAQAELATAEADAAGAGANLPIISTTSSSDVSRTSASVDQATASLNAGQHNIEAAKARLDAATARQRDADAQAVKAIKDQERLKGLVAKDEISQQQYDAAVAQAEGARAAADSAKAGIAEAQMAVSVAESRLIETRGTLDQAHANARTARTAPQQVEAAKARLAAADARVKTAKAALAQAELNLQYTTVKAAVDGIVSKRTAEIGQIVQPGQPLLAVVPLNDVWVTANFKETQLSEMRPGQKVSIKVDGYGGKKFSGTVDSIAAATGARFSLLPPENATGNFVKVVQRVPVKIVFDPNSDPDHLLRPGMSVEPTVYTK